VVHSCCYMCGSHSMLFAVGLVVGWGVKLTHFVMLQRWCAVHHESVSGIIAAPHILVTYLW
jgi:hypothetical protein